MKSIYLPISWSTYCTYTRKLAEAIITSGPTETQIVAIARGGLVLGRLLSDYLSVPVATITIQSYKDFTKPSELIISEHLKVNIKDKAILLVDDVADRGITFKRAVSYLLRFKPKSITTVSMLCKTQSTFRPDFFAQVTDKWVIFPYEVTETILHMIKTLREQGKTKIEIQTMLESLGYSDAEIYFVCKHYFKEEHCCK
ncbi:MAG: Phosphoribosyltransferase [Microgenomates group bacterium GW2011_GWC1_39_12]|nr:MAG: Phosphoribosyltransferase [Microgenomates group bacterium GW2011_GWC1_39_12]